MDFSCLKCDTPVDETARACPSCGEAITEFLRKYAAHPIDGKYQLLQRLGIGGMGEVYKARHVHLNSIRVIKMMRPGISEEASADERFLREARLATRIQHPNVATLHDFATLPDGTNYMVWEYIEGRNLAELIRSKGRLSLRHAATLSIQALAGLDSIHRAGIVHRDISPENIMITHDDYGQERVKIIDLGIAKSDDGATQTGVFIGKWKYCSPEHLGLMPTDQTIDGRADIYSYGIVLYEMLTGRPPFVAETPGQYILLHSHETPKSFATAELPIPAAPEIEAVIFKALEKDRNKRYTSAREFGMALERLLPSLGDRMSDDATTVVPVSGFATTAHDVAPATPSFDTAARTAPMMPSRPAPSTASNDATLLVSPAAAQPDTVLQRPTSPADATTIVPPPRKRSRAPLVAIGAVFLVIAAAGAIATYMIASRLLSEEATPQSVEAKVSPETQKAQTLPVTSGANPTRTAESGSTVEVDTRNAAPEIIEPAPEASKLPAVGGPARTETTLSPVVTPAKATERTPSIEQPQPETARPREPQPDVAAFSGSDSVAGASSFGARSRSLTSNSDFNSGSFRRGIIRDYGDMYSGTSVAWASVAPGIKLSEHPIRLARFRNLTNVEDKTMRYWLDEALQRQLDLLSGTAEPLTAQGAIYWASADPDDAGVGIEIIFRNRQGRAVAKLRHMFKEESVGDAAQAVVGSVMDFVNGHPRGR